ncbi:MFS transporter [Corallincola luteus]|uniref:MFS transporter n=1 Tax=Corallincola luteus TaxID=1775177 RepID=A0ABY2AG64_9GAMM|nr:MFS transporter [Corallincola luteus]TCI01487.1 MFS transporter [Corallincola luteus]
MTDRFRSPQTFLLLIAFAMPVAFSTWLALLNNFAIDGAGFTGKEIGILQSLREVPGFLAFTAVFVLLFIREQRFAVVSLLVLGVGVAITGFFPAAIGLYLTTILMSIGFHYLETINQSLTLQWLPKEQAAHFMGKAMAVKGAAAVLSFGGVWLLLDYFSVAYVWVYLLFGCIAVLLAVLMLMAFPQFQDGHEQHKKLILKRRYWLFYLLTFFSGARRQIFVVFAGFLMVEKFGYSAGQIALLFLFNHFFNLFFASRIGRWIGHIGERHALTIEYVGLFLVFTGYALVSDADIAAVLYVLDHLFFAFAIAIRTYFQKIASPEDIASTAGVSFSINHIAAVILPAALGLVWLVSPAVVFYLGAALALASLLLTQLIPNKPQQGNEIRWFDSAATAQRPAS